MSRVRRERERERASINVITFLVIQPFLAWCGEVCVSEAELSLAECHHCGSRDDGETM